MSKARDNASRNALVNVIPTTVAVNAGSASVSKNGTISFTDVSTLSLDGLFTSKFNDYKFVIKFEGHTTAWNNCGFSLRSGGTNSANAGRSNFVYITGTSFNTYEPGYMRLVDNENGTNQESSGGSWELYGPALPKYTTFFGMSAYINNSGTIYQENSSGVHPVSSSFDGFQLQMNNPTSGRISFYGYNI